MANIAILEPNWVGGLGILAPWTLDYVPLQNASWIRGNILVYTTTGTITIPPSTGPLGGTGGSGANQAGPAASAITFGTAVSASAPAQTYWYILTYTATGNESLASAEYMVSVPAGYVPTVNVASASAPAWATNYAAYIGIYPGAEALQQATKTTTALGTAFTTPYPLTNNAGVNIAASNANANIVGIALNNSVDVFYSGPGGSYAVNDRSLFGATNSIPPLGQAESYLAPVAKLQSALIEMSLVEPLSYGLIGQPAGLTLQSNGQFAIDTTATACATITGISQGVWGQPGQNQGITGDTGARVLVSFYPADLI
jgi:hypothetical protein